MPSKYGEGLKCPECRSNKIVSVGTEISRSMGRRRRFKCKNCARTFYPPVKKKGGSRKKGG